MRVPTSAFYASMQRNALENALSASESFQTYNRLGYVNCAKQALELVLLCLSNAKRYADMV